MRSFLNGRRMWIVVSAIVAATSSWPASASRTSDLGKACLKSPPGSEDSGWCHGYVSALIDSTFELTRDGKLLVTERNTHRASLATFSWCMPASLSLNGSVDVVKNFVRAHPELGDFTASFIVGAAFAEAFPCAGSVER